MTTPLNHCKIKSKLNSEVSGRATELKRPLRRHAHDPLWHFMARPDTSLTILTSNYILISILY